MTKYLFFTVSSEYSEKICNIFTRYKKALNDGKLLQIGFTTLSEYLWLLRSACQLLAPLKQMAILYLAAAVSDFYVPADEMVTRNNFSANENKLLNQQWNVKRKTLFCYSHFIRFHRTVPRRYHCIWCQRCWSLLWVCGCQKRLWCLSNWRPTRNFWFRKLGKHSTITNIM